MHIADEEDISGERLQRWEDYWVPYEELPEDVKQTDIDLVNQYLTSKPNYPSEKRNE